MAFVQDPRTEIAMQLVNIAIQAPGHPRWLPNVDPEECSLIAVTPVLAHCMKLSIAESWDLPQDDQNGRDRIAPQQLADDYCTLERVAHFAAVCQLPLSAEAQSEFQKIAPLNRNGKDIPPPKAP